MMNGSDNKYVMQALQSKVDYYCSDKYAAKMRLTGQVMKTCIFGIVVAAAGLFMTCGMLVFGVEAVRDLLAMAIMSGITASFILFCRVDQSIHRQMQERLDMAKNALRHVALMTP